jgi:hypothetical protein
MERQPVGRMLALGLGLGLILGPGAMRARAQNAGAVASTAGSTSSLSWMSNPALNPYANPYLNPMFNPYAAQVGMTPGNAGLYFYAAQQMTGGIGSGRLSGVRPAPGTAPAQKTAAHTPETTRETPHTSNTPGAGASHYFNRNFATSAGPPRYYNRQTRQHPSNSR